MTRSASASCYTECMRYKFGAAIFLALAAVVALLAILIAIDRQF